MIKARDAMIAWNKSEAGEYVKTPSGAVAVGPLLQPEEADWAAAYEYTGGATNTYRRELTDIEQKLHVLRDWYELVYGFGVHPYVAHRAFLIIEEYQDIIKAMNMGPAEDEPGHDPNVGFGRSSESPVPAISINNIGLSVHIWPE